MLNDYKYKESPHYFNKLHKNSPYEPPENIGYDFNYNKFIKHGIELRIFDYFPEEHLESIMNLIILLCSHSINHFIFDSRNDADWNDLVIECIKNGSNAVIKPDFYLKLDYVFNVLSYSSCFKKKNKTVLEVINKFGSKIYKQNYNSSICKKMAPNMKKVELIDYNSQIKQNFKILLKK
jgi:hypothetical protein